MKINVEGIRQTPPEKWLALDKIHLGCRKDHCTTRRNTQALWPKDRTLAAALPCNKGGTTRALRSYVKR